MSRLTLFPSWLALVALALLCPAISAVSSGSRRAALYARYSNSHSLGKDYGFDPRDGWSSVNITDLGYKYESPDDDESDSTLSARDNKNHEKSKKKKQNNKNKNKNKKKKSKGGKKKHPVVTQAAPKKHKSSGIAAVGDIVKGAVDSVYKGLKGIGEQEEVKITWYTGQDLENPSCWPNTDWTPTDESFACALTLDGWHSKPECFSFLELCYSSEKCVFVRVVDSCAGCDPGSKHVDLTKAAFSKLVSIDDGVAQVKMRGATHPDEWFLDLWGPEK
ncbi:hypothetical protein CYLTODRAFT_365132 [Cylindrobasidium torrendii FP15055 ss-10]|uniref:RlpA-like protein double-psi beta-barrel domain-containing protein n=1 Tax=Cylindrobasidium torrendii FP15055 ss-10 TaxID=1314674 RepID=A0A0D7BTZ7_9AGAR|nr:hypothetical protein CYLTODRAFT_365132 [Cylindrobasidium torrendii FP15055 ss-10]